MIMKNYLVLLLLQGILTSSVIDDIEQKPSSTTSTSTSLIK